MKYNYKRVPDLDLNIYTLSSQQIHWNRVVKHQLVFIFMETAFNKCQNAYNAKQN
mgnify:FL=1